MANDVQLRLKATLDTSEVKQQLQSLRNSQQQVLGNNGKSRTTADVSGGNLTGILQRLTNTLNSLENTIRRIGIGSQKFNQPGMTRNIGGTTVMPGGGYNRLREKLRANTSKYNQLVEKRIVQEDSLEDRIITRQNRIIDGYKKANNTNTKQFAHFVGGQVLGQAGDFLTKSGYTHSGNFVSGIGEGMTQGTMASFSLKQSGLVKNLGVANGIGAALGGITLISRVVSAIQESGDKIYEASKLMSQSAEKLQENFRNSVQEINTNSELKKAMRQGNYNETDVLTRTSENELYRSGKRRDRVYANPVINRMVQELKNAQTDYENTSWLNFYKKNKLAGFISEREKMLAPYMSEMTDADTDFANKRKSYVGLKKVREQIKSRSTGLVSSVEDFNLNRNLNSDDIGFLENLRNQINEKATRNRKYADGWFDMAKSGYGVTEDAVKTTEEYQKQLSYIDRIDAKLKQMKESHKQITNQANNFISDYNGNIESKKLAQQLYGIMYDDNGNEIGKNGWSMFRSASPLLDDFRKKAMENLKKSGDIAKSALNENLSIAERQKLIADADKAKSESDRYYGLASQVESFIKGISVGQIRPDMTNVTSLANMGFSMGENNDGINRLERYYSQMNGLVEQIRNKLQEGVKTESTYL